MPYTPAQVTIDLKEYNDLLAIQQDFHKYKTDDLAMQVLLVILNSARNIDFGAVQQELKRKGISMAVQAAHRGIQLVAGDVSLSRFEPDKKFSGAL